MEESFEFYSFAKKNYIYMSLNMSFLEVNKILASIIVALIAVGIISYFADVIFSFNEKDQKANAYKIEIIEPNNQYLII